MWKHLSVAAGLLLVGAVTVTASNPEPMPEVDVGPALTQLDHLTQSDVDAMMAVDKYDLDYLRQLGLFVFTTPFNTYDGYGDGPFDPDEYPPFAFGNRPTLQGNGLSLRVNGLDAQSCNECHVFVDTSTRPPTLGLGGVGGIVNNAIIMPTLIDVADGYDDRVSYVSGHDPDLPLEFDGVADYNGRYANPPFLFGGGGTELLGKEMTTDLRELLMEAQHAPAGTVISLDTHGVHFGSVTSLGGGEVEIHPEGVDEDLVIRPFGRKGENFSMRDFDRGAMQFHFGMQPVEVVGANVDADGDGIVNEVRVVEMSLLHIFDVTNPPPYMLRLDDNARLGYETFRTIGCSKCHMPSIRTNHRYVPLAYPEIPEAPWMNVWIQLDLVKVGFEPTRDGLGVWVPFFSDLKRHYMGEGLKESFEMASEEGRGEFITARLWGIGDTAPYLHDGRATTLYQAIWWHGGEAQGVRDTFFDLPILDQQRLLYFLMHLKTPELPNEELLR